VVLDHPHARVSWMRRSSDTSPCLRSEKCMGAVGVGLLEVAEGAVDAVHGGGAVEAQDGAGHRDGSTVSGFYGGIFPHCNSQPTSHSTYSVQDIWAVMSVGLLCFIIAETIGRYVYCL